MPASPWLGDEAPAEAEVAAKKTEKAWLLDLKSATAKRPGCGSCAPRR